MTDWKDRHREHKQETGLTWDEYHDRYFHHEDDVADLRETVAELTEHVQAVADAYDDLRRELWEVQEFIKARENQD